MAGLAIAEHPTRASECALIKWVRTAATPKTGTLLIHGSSCAWTRCGRPRGRPVMGRFLRRRKQENLGIEVSHIDEGMEYLGVEVLHVGGQVRNLDVEVSHSGRGPGNIGVGVSHVDGQVENLDGEIKHVGAIRKASAPR